MVDFLIQATLSNFLVAAVMAAVAWFVQRRVRSASLANLLWALVLIKMVTPPIFALPVFEVPRVSSVDEQSHDAAIPATVTENVEGNLTAAAVVAGQSEILTSDGSAAADSNRFVAQVAFIAIAGWLLVSVAIFIISAFRILRFHFLLRANSHLHPKLSQGLAVDVAGQFGIRRAPGIIVSLANIAPFVWWMSGRSVIVISKQATEKLNHRDLRLIITHEMAHIKRRDHWFRWLEWIALIGHWWNPVVWWVRHHLRVSEEVACDDLVLETAAPDVHQYANSLLNMAELLAAPAIRPPVVASAINSGGNLEKRLRMMIAKKKWKVPSALRMAIVAVAVCVFPLGIVYAQDFDAVERRLGSAVEAGELSLEQANQMMKALRSARKERETESKERRYAQYVDKIEAALKAGKISKEEAREKIIAAKREFFGVVREKIEPKREYREKQYKKYVEKLEAAVKAGKITKEEARKKMIAGQRELFGVVREKKEPRREYREKESKERRYKEYAEKIEAAIKAGKLSKEEARKKLIAGQRELFGIAGERKERTKSEYREMEARERRYKEIVQEIEEGVKDGKISESRAKRILLAKRRELFGFIGEKKEPRAENRDKGSNERRYKELAGKIEAAVRSGKLTKEEARRKLIAGQRELFGFVGEKKEPRREKREMESRERRYKEIVNEIEAAVKAGKMSKEEAVKKLRSMRREFFGDRDR